jgi:amino acid transporter
MKLKRELSYFDLTNIVIGAVVGADIYIASALSAGLIGPFSLIVWLIAGVFAVVIALVFAYCSYYVPKVGGPFSFVSKAFDDFYGFLTGWSMWIAEVVALSVFGIAFIYYLQYFVHLSFIQGILIKALFFFVLTFVNIFGVKFAGRLNNTLTILKLFPLLLLIFAGVFAFILHPGMLQKNYSPMLPLGLGNFGPALVLIFWAYAGFELGTLPASEVKNPKKTIPKAIITGMLIVTLFYLLTNFVVFGAANWKALAVNPPPLIFVGSALLGTVGAVIMSIGALISISGVDECGLLSTARLSYAMSIDGLFPKIFSKVHPKYKTPYMALIIQMLIAFGLSIFSGITKLISFSVFALAFSFLLTCLALIVLKKGKEKELHGQNILPWIGIAICLYLLYSTSFFDKVVGLALILIGIPIYEFLSPKRDIHHLKKLFVSEEAIFERRLERKEKFLANFARLLHRVYKKMKQN